MHFLQVMLTCARIITLITPSFIADESCVEQYNIALCCTRNMKRDYLAPVYVESIDTMPTYMSLIQYIDCRYVPLPISNRTLYLYTKNLSNYGIKFIVEVIFKMKNRGTLKMYVFSVMLPCFQGTNKLPYPVAQLRMNY